MSRTTTSRRRSSRASLLILAPLAAAGCGSGKPVSGTFAVDFPTVADAVNTSTVQIFAYPYSASQSCEVLFQLRRTTQAVSGMPVAQTQPTSPCALSQTSDALPLPFGDYSFLAVGQRNGSDFLIGCAAQTLSDSNSVVVIPLTLESNTESVPTTSCTSLSSFCGKQCM